MYEGEYHGKKKHPRDLSSVLERAFGNGVERIIVTGGSLEESREVPTVSGPVFGKREDFDS